MEYALGTDVSRYEHPCNGTLGYQRGLRFAFVRVSVGDYYTDTHMDAMWRAYKEAGCLVGGYLVTAPKDPGMTRQISAQAHLDRFVNSISSLTYKPDLPWVLDAELERGERTTVITKLQKDVSLGLAALQNNRLPIVYTRMSWWDTYVKADPLWGQMDLFPARYSISLTSPWSDGKCRFRDWKTWKFWQYTASADATYWGWGENGSCHEGDLDYFNGDEKGLYEYAGLEPALSVSDKVEILWREAERLGWNLNP